MQRLPGSKTKKRVIDNEHHDLFKELVEMKNAFRQKSEETPGASYRYEALPNPVEWHSQSHKEKELDDTEGDPNEPHKFQAQESPLKQEMFNAKGLIKTQFSRIRSKSFSTKIVSKSSI